MSIFLALMVAGLTGMVVMALPGMSRFHTGHGLHLGGHSVPHLGAHAGHAGGAHAAGHGAHHAESGGGLGKSWLGGLIPSPRTIFSLLALYGAFGYTFVEAGHLAPNLAGLAALAPAWLIERFMVTPLWNFLFQFQAEPDKPLEALMLCEAKAVTPFANGRGIVSVVRDGRTVQFSARLIEDQSSMHVRVGDRLCIEDVDAQNERVTVRLG